MISAYDPRIIKNFKKVAFGGLATELAFDTAVITSIAAVRKRMPWKVPAIAAGLACVGFAAFAFIVLRADKEILETSDKETFH